MKSNSYFEVIWKLKSAKIWNFAKLSKCFWLVIFGKNAGHRVLKIIIVSYLTMIYNFVSKFCQIVNFLESAPPTTTKIATLTVPWSGLCQRQKYNSIQTSAHPVRYKSPSPYPKAKNCQVSKNIFYSPLTKNLLFFVNLSKKSQTGQKSSIFIVAIIKRENYFKFWDWMFYQSRTTSTCLPHLFVVHGVARVAPVAVTY